MVLAVVAPDAAAAVRDGCGGLCTTSAAAAAGPDADTARRGALHGAGAGGVVPEVVAAAAGTGRSADGRAVGSAVGSTGHAKINRKDFFAK